MTEPRFRLVETTADAGLLAWGYRSQDLFENAACGLYRVIVKPGRHRLLTEVKGITYHRLEIRRRGKRLRARLVLDL